MNLYILVEDGKSGHKIIDNWIANLMPSLTRVASVNEVTEQNYVIFSGLGYPRLLGTDSSSSSRNVLGQTIETLNQIKKFDYFLIFLDGDDEGVQARKNITIHKIEHYKEHLSCPYQIFVQNKCIETWLLGNRDYFPKTYSQSFEAFANHYNVALLDPELMENDSRALVTTNALYHERYLRQMMQEVGLHYLKSRAHPVMYSRPFIEGLQQRVIETNDLKSLKEFFDFIQKLNQMNKVLNE